ncbi:MAG: hypothetical protein U9O89_07140 [Thermoproteota archaeon]|nr:hypothetical protein [Thermoproteota archaeon]
MEKDYQPMRRTYYRVPGENSKPIESVLSKGDLSKIDLRIGELFESGAWLTVLKYDGRLSWLTSDLMISQEALSPSTMVQVEVILPSTLIVLCILLGAACTLAGVVCPLLIMRLRKTAAKTG